jgi:hypothetical protein
MLYTFSARLIRIDIENDVDIDGGRGERFLHTFMRHSIAIEYIMDFLHTPASIVVYSYDRKSIFQHKIFFCYMKSQLNTKSILSSYANERHFKWKIVNITEVIMQNKVVQTGWKWAW